MENSARRFQQFESELPPEAFADLVSRRNIPFPRSRVTPAASPAKSSVMPWVVIAVLGTVLIGMVAQHHPSETWSPRNEVTTLRAQPVATPAPAMLQYGIGAQQMTTMPYGSRLLTTFKGYLSDVSQLPLQGAQPGDMWAIGTNLWVLTTPPGSFRQGWVDPPGDGVEVRRALPVDGVEVRRAKIVVPRAEFVRLPG